jgi:hypothetical protein
MVRAKFQVQQVINHVYGGKTVILMPQYDETIPEDRRFAKATPSGEMKLYIDNPPASDYLALGLYFYVDFTEVPKAEAAKA